MTLAPKMVRVGEKEKEDAPTAEQLSVLIGEIRASRAEICELGVACDTDEAFQEWRAQARSDSSVSIA
jgi:hypothetical protein